MGLYSIGAADFAVTKYREEADKIGNSGHGVLAFRKNNPVPDMFPFPSGEGASAKYDSLADAPGDYVYLYLYRDGRPVDEAYFTATAETRYETKTETRKERVGLGWILGGIGLGLLGFATFRKRS